MANILYLHVCVQTPIKEKIEPYKEMAQRVTVSVTEHQLALAQQTGNRESSRGGGVCARAFGGGWYTAGRWTWFGQHAKNERKSMD